MSIKQVSIFSQDESNESNESIGPSEDYVCRSMSVSWHPPV